MLLMVTLILFFQSIVMIRIDLESVLYIATLCIVSFFIEVKITKLSNKASLIGHPFLEYKLI